MITRFSTIRIALFLTSIFLILSCDDETSTVGGTVLTGTDITLETMPLNVELKEVPTERIQTNNLPFYHLGTVINEFGETNYGVLFNVSHALANSFSDFKKKDKEVNDSDITIKSVSLVIPYSSYTFNGLNNSGMPTYTADIVSTASTVLEIEASLLKQDLRLNDPNDNVRAVYFSNATARFSDPGTNLISDTDPLTIQDSFLAPPSTIEVSNLNNKNETASTSELRANFEATNAVFKIDLSNQNPSLLTTFQEALNNDGLDFFTNGAFEKAIKGIYLKPKDGNLGLFRLFNFSTELAQSKLEIVFDGPPDTTNNIAVSFPINQTNNQIVNIIERTPNVITKENTEIHLVGGSGSIATVDLFPDPAELETLFNDNVLLNEAILRLKVDEISKFYNKEQLPTNLILVSNGDIEATLPPNNEKGAQLIDFTNSFNSNASITAIEDRHLFPLKETNEGLFYEINITEHVQRILNQQTSNLSTALDRAKDFNVQLSLGVSEVPNSIQDPKRLYFNLSSEILSSGEDFYTNINSALTTKGVPIHGSNTPNEEDKPKLIIKLTSSN